MQKKIRIITLMVVFVLTALTSFGASKNYLQVSDIEPKLSNIQIDNKPILAYGEDSNGFISYTVVDESSFDDFFKETASLDAITNISNLLVTDFNKKLNTLSDKSTAKVVYADLLESIKYSYNALDKEVKNLNNLKDTGKNLSNNFGKVKLTKKIAATQGVAQSIKNLDNVSSVAPKLLEQMKKILDLMKK